MFVHLSKNEGVNLREIVGVFDIESSTVSKETRNFLKTAESAKRLCSLCDDLPKSFVVTDNEFSSSVYLTQISGESIVKRTR